jgi:hypothetical protein
MMPGTLGAWGGPCRTVALREVCIWSAAWQGGGALGGFNGLGLAGAYRDDDLQQGPCCAYYKSAVACWVGVGWIWGLSLIVLIHGYHSG